MTTTEGNTQTTTDFWTRMEFRRFGIMPISMTAQSCLASAAVAYALELPKEARMTPLVLIAMITMGANAVAIAQGPMRLVLGAFVFSILTSLFVLIYALSY